MKDNRNHFEKAQALSLSDVGFEFEFFPMLPKEELLMLFRNFSVKK